MALKRNEDNELYLLRSVVGAMREEVYALIEENRDGDRNCMVVHSPAERISDGMYMMMIVVSNLKRRTTIPYLEIFDSSPSDLESDSKDVIKEILTKPKDSIIVKIGKDDESYKTFRNKVIKHFGNVADDDTPSIQDCYEDIKKGSPFKTVAQIVKETIADLDDILDNELDEDDYEDFNYTVGKYSNKNSTVMKDKKTFNFDNGIKLTVKGFKYNDKKETTSYTGLVADLQYKLKREAKSDDMYN